MARKPVVPPKIGSKVKLEKMLAKSMKTLTIGSKRKINMEDSSSGDSDEEDEGMNVDQLVPKITEKKIKKKAGSMAMQKAMKKHIRRIRKTGHKKLARAHDERRMFDKEEAIHGVAFGF